MLRTWSRWRGNNTVRKNARSIALVSPKTRQLQDTQVYSKLFYQSKLKPIVEAETSGASNAERLAKIVDITKREWANESDEVKAQVRAMKDDISARSVDVSSPEQRQAAIKDLSRLATAFFDHVHKTTSWTGYIVLGGPEPGMGDEIAIGS